MLALRRELTTGEELLAWAVESELFTTPALLETTKIYLDEHWGVGDRTALPTSARPPSRLPLTPAGFHSLSTLFAETDLHAQDVVTFAS